MMQLVIGNKNYSSWSMRPWVLLSHFGIEFEEVRIPLFTPGYRERLLAVSGSGKVPVLIDAGVTVWDSLAICEYVSERYLDNRGWPGEVTERALCRAYCSEMHGGFPNLRQELPMNCRAIRRLEFSSAVQQEIERLNQLWSEARERFQDRGDYLFGEFSIADCMYAPMAMRCHSYGVPLSGPGRDYVQTLMGNPAVARWRREALAEEEILPDFEIGEECPA